MRALEAGFVSGGSPARLGARTESPKVRPRSGIKDDPGNVEVVEAVSELQRVYCADVVLTLQLSNELPSDEAGAARNQDSRFMRRWLH